MMVRTCNSSAQDHGRRNAGSRLSQDIRRVPGQPEPHNLKNANQPTNQLKLNEGQLHSQRNQKEILGTGNMEPLTIM